MAIFRLPPQPFVGGRQPLDSRDLSPVFEAVPEDNPPFGLHQPLYPVILTAWQPDQGPPPQQTKYLPVSVSAVPEDNPPFAVRGRDPLSSIVQAWQPPPPEPWPGWKVNPSIEAVPEDNPPFSNRGRDPLSSIVDAWQPDLGPQRQQGHQRLPDSVDNPPLSYTSQANLNVVVSQWQPDMGPQPQQGRHVPASVSAVPEDNPPFGAFRPILPSIIDQWQPPPPMPWNGWDLSPIEGVVSADDPPFGSRTHLPTIMQSWQQDPQAPMRQGFVAVAASGFDAPPPASRAALHSIISAWQTIPQPFQRSIDVTADGTVYAKLPFVPRDPKLELPLRKFVDMIAQIANSLIRQNVLVYSGEATWRLVGTDGIEMLRAPAVVDDETHGYHVGQIWVDSITGIAYVAISVADNAAVWRQIT